MDFKKYVRSGGITTAAPTVQALIEQGTKEGWKLQASKETGSVIQLSKAGNAQLVFKDKTQQAIFVRVSDNALDAIGGGTPAMELPVYEVELHEQGDPTKPVIGYMLAIGITANGNTDWVDAKPADIANAFKVPVTVGS